MLCWRVMSLGLVIFNIANETPRLTDTISWKQIGDVQDRLYFAMINNLTKHDILRKGRDLALKPQVVTIFPEEPNVPENIRGFYCDMGHTMNYKNYGIFRGHTT